MGFDKAVSPWQMDARDKSVRFIRNNESEDLAEVFFHFQLLTVILA